MNYKVISGLFVSQLKKLDGAYFCVLCSSYFCDR